MATSPMSELIQQLRRTVLLRDGAGLTDGQLLDDYIGGRDEAALAALVRRHGPMVWGVCRRVLGNYHDAEDAFQATFLVLIRKATSIVPREMVANWLYGVAHQTALKARATVSTREGRERQVVEMPEPAAAEQAQWDELQPVLDEELSRLPDKYRAVVVLSDLEGKTRKEVARQLGVPEGTVAGWIARARVMLAKRLVQRGITLSGGALATMLSRNVASAGVPALVVSNTIKAASLSAAGQAATGMISVKVAALTEGVLKTMFLTKLKIATAVLLVAVLGVGVGGRLYQTQAVEPAKEPAKVVQPEPALDLTKIDRTIRKEPAYRGKPRYALLVFGPKAETRMWLVIDDQTLYVDRNGNGDLTENGERVAVTKVDENQYVEFHASEIVEADGKTKHSNLIVYQYFARQFGQLVNTINVMDVAGTFGQGTSGENGCSFAATAKDAPIIHINGPMTLRAHSVWVEFRGGRKLKEVPYQLDMGEKVAQLHVQVGTPGHGKGTFAAIASEKGFPADLHPMVEINVPSKTDPKETIKLEFSLKERCCGTQFHGPVQVPEAGGQGKAKVTLSFPDWKKGKVAPAVVELPVLNVFNPGK